MNKRSSLLIPILTAVLAGATLISCAGNGAQSPTSAAGTTIPVVAVARAARADLASNLALSAEFEPFQEVDVMAKVSGYLRDIRVDIGDRVHAGQLLATLELPEMEDDLTRASAVIDEADATLATAREELTRAESAHQIAHLSYDRIQDVSKREPGLVPQQEVDEARSRDLVAEAQTAAAKSIIRTGEQHIRVARADAARLRTLQKYTVITAPFEGVVTRRYASVGSLIQAGTASQTQAMPVARVSQNELLRLILPVPESSVAGIHFGQTVSVRVSSLNRTFKGRVTRFANKLQMSTRTMDTEVDVPNPGLLLIPGMYAEVNLTLLRHDHTLTVPPDAIDGAGSASPRVYAVDAANTIRILPVSIGLETSRRVEVLAGLKDGDAVVTGRHTDLTEGERVQPKFVEFDKDDSAGKVN
ncbi:MAG: efflux RND transporter periplasmic adaptor subunit [Acidobacteriota bacterium]